MIQSSIFLNFTQKKDRYVLDFYSYFVFAITVYQQKQAHAMQVLHKNNSLKIKIVYKQNLNLLKCQKKVLLWNWIRKGCDGLIIRNSTWLFRLV